MNDAHESRDLIGVVLKKGSDYEAFATLLDQHNFVYVIRFKRIFYIDGTLDSFNLKEHVDIESCEIAVPVVVEPLGAVDVVDAKVLGNDPNVNGVFDNTSSGYSNWGPHRTIRRKSPFRQHEGAVTHQRSLPYRSQRTGEGVDIYILDSGFDSNHVEWKAGKVEWAGGTNETSGVVVGDTVFRHTQGGATHGQWVASCAVGQHNGIARDSHLFFAGMQGSGINSEEQWLAWFETPYNHYMARAGTNRPAILNISSASLRNDLPPSAAARAGYETMMENGLIITTAAANSKWNLDTDNVLPAKSHPDMIVAGATTCFDTPMNLSYGAGEYMSGYGTDVDIWAAGQKTLAAHPFGGPNEYGVVSGTSFAGPHTAGVIACMLQGYQRLTSLAQVQAVAQKLIANSTKGELRFGDAYYGEGVWHDRLLYLDPHIEFEEIDGLIPL